MERGMIRCAVTAMCGSMQEVKGSERLDWKRRLLFAATPCAEKLAVRGLSTRLLRASRSGSYLEILSSNGDVVKGWDNGMKVSPSSRQYFRCSEVNALQKFAASLH